MAIESFCAICGANPCVCSQGGCVKCVALRAMLGQLLEGVDDYWAECHPNTMISARALLAETKGGGDG
jgi:hypothetical protein